ncbi:hypothetical protein N7532_005014 [Penicillium argentinense]|uniref:Uncharacterized protein n=1 Tax=Penicillium argentinense TaxID=1131581 RepID=A0A9W9FD31_9EURO|nr:uncharacterized protein N7532_005014 [Penicillium argentinense]KAJ5098013.1 hypothetical protein N7532_005014 [Penicillium argentinense]
MGKQTHATTNSPMRQPWLIASWPVLAACARWHQVRGSDISPPRRSDFSPCRRLQPSPAQSQPGTLEEWVQPLRTRPALPLARISRGDAGPCCPEALALGPMRHGGPLEDNDVPLRQGWIQEGPFGSCQAQLSWEDALQTLVLLTHSESFERSLPSRTYTLGILLHLLMGFGGIERHHAAFRARIEQRPVTKVGSPNRAICRHTSTGRHINLKRAGLSVHNAICVEPRRPPSGGSQPTERLGKENTPGQASWDHSRDSIGFRLDFLIHLLGVDR